jgi:hypothetical protein
MRQKRGPGRNRIGIGSMRLHRLRGALELVRGRSQRRSRVAPRRSETDGCAGARSTALPRCDDVPPSASRHRVHPPPMARSRWDTLPRGPRESTRVRAGGSRTGRDSDGPRRAGRVPGSAQELAGRIAVEQHRFCTGGLRHPREGIPPLCPEEIVGRRRTKPNAHRHIAGGKGGVDRQDAQLRVGGLGVCGSPGERPANHRGRRRSAPAL